MKKQKSCLPSSYSDHYSLAFIFLTRVFLPVTLVNIFVFEYQNFLESKKNHFQGTIHILHSQVGGVENISINSNYSISFIFVFPDFLKEFDEFKICFKSWKTVFPQSEIFVCFSQNGNQSFNNFSAGLASKEEFMQIKLFPKVESDEIDIIYVDDLFQKIFQTIKTDLVCLIRSDSILPIETREKINFLSTFFYRNNQQFAVIGNRCSLKLKITKGEFNLSLVDSYYQNFIQNDILRTVNFKDNSFYSNDFIFLSIKYNKLNIDDIPNFHFGMERYDTWIPGWLEEFIPVVSLGNECASYNIGSFHNHDYDFLDKISENFMLAKFKEDKFTIAANLNLKIVNRSLVNGTFAVAVF